MSAFKTVITCLAMLMTSHHAMCQEPTNCADGASIRKFNGPKPLIQILWKSLKGTKVPIWKRGEFHEQEFNYLGHITTEHTLHLVNFTTIWGQSCRATKRLLVFDSKNRLLGMYSHLESEIKNIQNNRLIHESGQADFTNGPPSKIENATFESAYSIRKGY